MCYIALDMCLTVLQVLALEGGIRFFGDIAGGVDTGIDVSLLCLSVKVEAFIGEFRIHMRYNRRCIDMLGKCLHQLLHYSSPLQRPVAI